MVFCGTPSAVATGYARAGLSSTGGMSPDRWSVAGGASNTLTIDCNTSARTVSASPLFAVKGDATDVSGVRVQLVYEPTSTPPVKLQCSANAGASFTDC